MRPSRNTSAKSMRAVDTNLLVRLIVQDDPEQPASATNFSQDGVGFRPCPQAGHLPLGTFDRDLGRLDGAQKL
jgi:hypothetical protein